MATSRLKALAPVLWAGFTALTPAPQAATPEPTPPRLAVEVRSDRSVRLAWSAAAGPFLLEQADALGATTAWQEVPLTPERDGESLVVTLAVADASRFFRLREGVLPLVTLAGSSPLPGETGVAVTRETIVRFTAPLAPNAILNTNHFYARAAGRRLLARIELASDRERATLFYLEPLPGGTRVVAAFDGTGLEDASGRPLDADGDGVEGGVAVIPFETLSNTPVPGTAVTGWVFASELVPGTDTGTNAVNQPLAGVTITVDGMEQTMRAVTDAQGRFTLQPVPPGRFFVHIDGRTVADAAAGIRYPDKSYYPFVGKAWDAVAGRTNLAGGTGEVFLPLITAGTMQPVSATQDTVIAFPPNVISNNPALAGVAITVPANALYGDDGARGGKVGIAPVPPDRLPGPLPPGLEMPIVITVQTDGPLNFDRPAPVCFPNLPDPVLKTPLPAGSKQALISFNHDKGEWEAVGSMTVSADGKLICTDPGSGILQPGWHGVAPTPKGPPPPPKPRDPSCFGEAGDRRALQECDRVCELQTISCKAKYTEALLEGLERCDLDPLTALKCKERVGMRDWAFREECEDDERDCQRWCSRCFASEPRRLGLAGAPDRVEAEVEALLDEIDALLLPFTARGLPAPPEVFDRIDSIRQQLDAVTGGDVIAYLTAQIIAAEDEIAAIMRARGMEPDAIKPGNAPDYPVLYSATILRSSLVSGGVAISNAVPGEIVISNSVLQLRGATGPRGQYSLFVPRDGKLLDVSFYDAISNRVGIVSPHLSPKAAFDLPRFRLLPAASAPLDTDADGLSDIVEEIYGTDPEVQDSDGDGVNDGAEVAQGSNPLDGRPGVTGVVATASTSGPALDLWTGDGWVAIAEGAAGVSIFGEYRGGNPTRLAQVAVPGSAQRISGTEDRLLIPAGDAGLSVIGVRDPANLRFEQPISLSGAQAVVGLGSSAYVGTASGLVVKVDLVSGLVLDHLSLTHAIWDLAIEGDTLYALTDNRLFTVSVKDHELILLGSVEAPVSSPNRRLFVGGGIAYTVHNQGYNTFDLADPAKPVLRAAGRTSQFGWLQIVPNGSGLGLAAVGPTSGGNSPRDVSLYDLSDPRTNDLFLTTFVTPGIARAVAIHNGLGYIADDTAGLQVVNYLAFDTRRTAPTVELQPGFPAEGVTEGSRVWVAARVTDDVQVRHVEFFLDGQLVSSDGSFPFEFRFTAPARTANQTNFTVQARAVDTGGNSRLSEALVVSLLPDTTPPTALAHYPRGGARSVDRLHVFLGEPPNPSTLTTNSFVLQSAGADGVLGTADDLAVSGGTVTFQPENGAAVLALGQLLPDGLYRATLDASVSDLAGNPLGTDLAWSFRVGNAVFWTGQIDDRWANPLNWSEGRLPAAEDAVVIDAFGAEITVTHDLEPSSVRSLTSYERLQLGTANKRGLLQVSATLDLHRDLTLEGGSTLQGATVVQHGEARLRVTNRGGTLDRVSVQGDLVLTNAGARLLIRNGLTLQGSVRLDNGAAIGFSGDQSFDAGNVVFEGNSGFLSVDGNSTLTLGPEVVIRGKSGALTSGVFSGSGFPRLINRGRIVGDVASGALTVGLWTFENAGTLEVAPGSTLLSNGQNWTNRGQIVISDGAKATFAGKWSNSGIIRLNEGTLALGGNFTASGLGTLQRTGGVIELVNGGDLDLEGGTLRLDNTIGPWVLRGGTIRRGTLVQDGNGRLVFSNFGGVLDALTVEGDLDLTLAGSGVTLRNGLTLQGTARLDNSGAFTILGDQTLHRGTIEFAGSSGVVRIEGNATWTLAPETVVRGRTGAIGQGFTAGSSRLINQGLIAADVPGGTLTLVPARFENSGTLRADGAGATLLIRVTPSVNTGTIEELNGGRVRVSP